MARGVERRNGAERGVGLRGGVGRRGGVGLRGICFVQRGVGRAVKKDLGNSTQTGLGVIPKSKDKVLIEWCWYEGKA